MALALPGSRRLFSQMQEALFHVKGKRVTLSNGLHEALAVLRWMAEDVSNIITPIYKLVLFRSTMDVYHDVSGYMCGGVALPGPTAKPRILLPHPSAAWPSPNPIVAHPVVWRAPFPKDVVDSLVSSTNSQGTVNNS